MTVDDGRAGITEVLEELVPGEWWESSHFRMADEVIRTRNDLADARRQVETVLAYAIEAVNQSASSERRHVDHEWNVYLMGREDTARTIMEIIRGDTPPQGEDATE